MDVSDAELPTARAAALERRAPEARWLIEGLWTRAAAGLIGAQPKSAKTWTALEMATAVATATPCLGRFAVHDPGPVLVYLAEDALADVRARLEGLAARRGLALDALDLHVVTAPVVRLDLEQDRARLDRTLERIRPRLLVLDPLVRMHRLNENDSGDVSGLLGELRALQRRFDLALVLVHHATKRTHAHPGQGLRGSGDIYAWIDSCLFLRRLGTTIELTAEHRAAASPPPLHLALVTGADGVATHLELRGAPDAEGAVAGVGLEGDVLAALGDADGPLFRATLRRRLRVNNERLGRALLALEHRGAIRRTTEGWELLAPDDQTLELPIA